MPATPSAIRSICMLDPDLRDEGGHYFAYTRAIEKACRGIGIAFQVVGNKAFDADKNEAPVTPAFDGVSEPFVPRLLGGYLLDPLIGQARFLDHLRRYVTPKVGPDQLVFAATANHRHLAPLARWLSDFTAHSAPALSILLRFSELDASGRLRRTAVLTRRGLRALERLAGPYRLRLVADSESLASEYRRLTSLTVHYCPIPHLIPDELLAERTREAGSPRFAFLGQARAEKGFPTLVESLRILADGGRLPNAEFAVQCYTRPGEAAAAVEARRDLAQIRGIKIQMLPGILDSDSYYRLLLSCSAVVLPYVREHYRSRNSGILTDALAAGIPVIATAGSWMAEQVEAHGAGLSFADGSADELARAIGTLHGQLSKFQQAATARALAWRETHQPAYFVRELRRLFQ